MFDQRALAGGVSLVHRADLRHGNMRLIDDQQEIIRKEVEQRMRRRAGRAAVEMTRIVFDPRAHAHLGEHLQVIGGAHVETLRLKFLALFAQFGQPSVKLLADGFERAFHTLRPGHIVGSREDMDLRFMGDHIAGQRMQGGDAVDLVAEEFDADGQFLVYGDDFDRIAPHAERAAGEGDVVALVLHGHEPAQQVVAIDLLAFLEKQHTPGVFLRSAQAVDAGDGGHDHAVASGQQVGRGLMAQTFHIIVDVGVFLDIGVGLRYVGLRLIVVVVGNEIAHRVVGHELAEFGAQLRGERLVRLDDERGTLQPFDQPCGGGGFAGAGGAHEHHVVLAVLDARGQFLDGLRLVSGWLVRRFDHKRLVHTFDVESHALFPSDSRCIPMIYRNIR